MPGIGEKTVLEVLRRTMQSDSKTDQKNKQQQVLLKGHHGKIDKDNFVYQQGYLKGQFPVEKTLNPLILDPDNILGK